MNNIGLCVTVDTFLVMGVQNYNKYNPHQEEASKWKKEYWNMNSDNPVPLKFEI